MPFGRPAEDSHEAVNSRRDAAVELASWAHGSGSWHLCYLALQRNDDDTAKAAEWLMGGKAEELITPQRGGIEAIAVAVDASIAKSTTAASSSSSSSSTTTGSSGGCGGETKGEDPPPPPPHPPVSSAAQPVKTLPCPVYNGDEEALIDVCGCDGPGDVDEARDLIARGINIDQQCSFNQRTALWCAAFYGRLELVKVLVQAGADVDLPDMTDSTALIGALQRHATDVPIPCMSLETSFAFKTSIIPGAMQELIHERADIDLDIVQELIRAGAALDAEDEEGYTARHYAQEKGNDEVVAALDEAAAAKVEQREPSVGAAAGGAGGTGGEGGAGGGAQPRKTLIDEVSLIEGRFHALICERNSTDKAALESKGFVFPRIACLDDCTCGADNGKDDTLLVCPKPGCGCDEKDDRGVFLCGCSAGEKAAPDCGVDGNYPVPGMYGGFYSTCLGKDESSGGGSWYLTCESWCRVAGGSGQRHRITAEATVLTEDGFC